MEAARARREEIEEALQGDWDAESEEHKAEQAKLAEEKTQLDAQIEELENEPDEEEAEYPLRVHTEDRLNVILFGPEGCGQEIAAQYLSEKSRRGLVDLAQILQWNVEHETVEGKEASEWLESKKEELEQWETDNVKRKPKTPEEEEEIANERKALSHLPAEHLKSLIRARVAHPDCNGGAVFDNLKGDKWDFPQVVEVISEALVDENLQLSLINFQTNSDDLAVVDNYRYKIRKVERERGDELDVLNQTLESKSEMKKTEKSGKKAKAAKAKTEEQLEEERKKKEEEELKRQESERRAELKLEKEKKQLDETVPAVLSEEEKEAFAQELEKLVSLFGEIVMKQSRREEFGNLEGEAVQEEVKEGEGE